MPVSNKVCKRDGLMHSNSAHQHMLNVNDIFVRWRAAKQFKVKSFKTSHLLVVKTVPSVVVSKSPEGLSISQHL